MFAEHTDLIEPLSLDEAYLDVTGLNASAGISYCKFLANMASDLNKPNGQAVMTSRMGPTFVAALAVKKFHGVGPATAAKMERLGILTGADLKAKSLPFLQENLASRAHGIIG